MWSNDFEAQTIKHPYYYVAQLRVDVLRSRIDLALIYNPETEAVAVEISFSQCKDIEIMHFGEVDLDKHLPSFLGIANKVVEQGMKYHIGTDVAQVEFESNAKPKVEWFDKAALKYEYHPEIVRIEDQDTKT